MDRQRVWEGKGKIHSEKGRKMNKEDEEGVSEEVTTDLRKD